MKRKLPLMILILLTLAGCASQEAYRSYTQAIVDVNKNRQQPGIVQEFDASGRLVRQAIVMPDQPVTVAQIKDSEWASPISMALSLGVFGLSNWAISREWAGALKTVQPNITTTAGGNMAGGDVSIPTTTTQTTTTTTNSAPETLP